jgi:F-type H+-transporting ATPase subunit delta
MSLFATRYARAFAESVAASKLDPAAVNSQLDDFTAAWKESPELRQFFESPAFPPAQKVAFLDKLNEKIGLTPLVRNFLAVLLDHDRIGAVNEVIEAYRREMDERQGIYEAEIVSARKLDDDERRQLEAQVGQVAGGRVKANYREDKSLMGGAIVTIGSTVYDGSVRGRLDRLKEQLVAG